MSKSLTQEVLARYASDGTFITLMDSEGIAIPPASNVVLTQTNLLTGGLIFSAAGRRIISPLAIGASAVLFGDSITQYCSATISSRAGIKSIGYFGWLNAMLGDRALDLSYNAGTGGDTTTQMLARISTDVLAKTCDIVFVMGGTNDIGAAVPASTIIANLRQIYSRILASGRSVVAMYCPGFGAAAAGNRVAYNAAAATVNAWIATQYAAGLVHAVDTYSAMQDTAGAFADDKHPTAVGAKAMAAAIYARVGGLLDFLPSRYSNLLSNGQFFSSGTNWTTGSASGGAVGAVTYGEATIGNYAEVPVTFTNGTSSAYLRGEALHTQITPGEYVWMEADVTLIEASGLAGIQAQMQYQVDAVSTAAVCMYRDTVANSGAVIGEKMRYKSIPAQLSGASITICRPEFWAYALGAGSATFRVENVKVFKRT